MGWTVPWYSSWDSDFNYDFHVTNDKSKAPVEYNYKDADTLRREGLDVHISGESHGLSVFRRDGDTICHTYSAYGRGLDRLLGTYHILDFTPLGRQRYVNEFSHHDRYETTDSTSHCGNGAHE
jgi:predicted dithiol-disulfide oxidoreductase (DUF899 family)